MEHWQVERLKPHPRSLAIYGEEETPPDFLESIQRLGILVPLVVKHDGTIISGHRRWQAARLLKMETVPVQPTDYADELDERRAILEFNRQRDKTSSQRMAEAQEVKAIEGEQAKRRQAATQVRGRDADGRPVFGVGNVATTEKGRARDKVAGAVGMRPRTFAKVERVWLAAQAGDPVAKEQMQRLDTGQVTANAAYKQVTQAEQKRAAVVAIESLPPLLGEYPVIVVDPPWQYDNRADDAQHRARNPYPSMSVEDIKALHIPAAPDSVLWLWTTNAFMHEAFHVLEAWGFTPKTILTWAKDRMGLGDWLRGQTEHCILAVKGRPIVTLTNQTTVLRGPLREHSRKPDEFYQLVESLCPGPKLEMFARAERGGWNTYGAERDKFSVPA